MRRALGEAALIFAGEMVQVNADYFEADIRPFQALLAQTTVQPESSQTLAHIISLYRGEFLQSLSLPDAPEFEMWLVGQRSYWRQLYERGALALLKRLIDEGQYATAVPLAQKLVQQNPLLEEAHYQLIWLYAQTEQRTAAIAQFKQCQTMLQQELAVEPMPALQTLYGDIVAGRLHRSLAVTPIAPTLGLSATVAVDFVGREEEWQQLNEAWAAVGQGNGRFLQHPAAGGNPIHYVHCGIHHVKRFDIRTGSFVLNGFSEKRLNDRKNIFHYCIINSGSGKLKILPGNKGTSLQNYEGY